MKKIAVIIPKIQPADYMCIPKNQGNRVSMRLYLYKKGGNIFFISNFTKHFFFTSQPFSPFSTDWNSFMAEIVSKAR